MNFYKIAQQRQSCRAYDKGRSVEDEKLQAVLEAGRLSPSACNAQPYHITVCRGESAAQVCRAVQGMGMNTFCSRVPVFLVISEESYNRTAAVGAKIKHNDFRSIDIGILTAYLTAEAAAQGLASCILGWLDDERLRDICGVKNPVRLVIALGYAAEGDKLREKKRKDLDEIVSYR